LHKLVYSNRWLSLYEGDNQMSYVACDSGVMVVPVTADGNVILIYEPTAYGDDEKTLFVPSGKINEDESADQSANRELQEEIGLAAGRLEVLAEVEPWAKYLKSSLTIFLARELTPSERDGDEDYDIEQKRVPLNSFETLIAEGSLTDTTVISALYLARQRLTQETSADDA
jgi:ADP-ribose diphosphatase